MKRLMLVAVITAMAAPTWLTALTKSYDVIPFRNCIGTTDSIAPNNKVTQYYRNTLDELTMVSFWCGDAGDTSSFNVEVMDSVSSQVVADTHGVRPTGSWKWLDMPLQPVAGRDPVRGRTYKVVVTRQSGQPISFAYDPTSPYRYGSAYVPGSVPTLPDSADVALRIYGLHDKVDTLSCGMDEESNIWTESAVSCSLLVARAREADVGTIRRYIWWQDVESESGSYWFTGDFGDTVLNSYLLTSSSLL